MDMTPTPHNSAKKGDFAKTVLMPGDPKRADFIAENFLENAILVNDVRGIRGYTGYYKGKRVSVMASGMGMPSIGIYSYELFNFYDVDNIIRVGTAGAVADGVGLWDIVIGMGGCTDSSYANVFGLRGTFAPIASYELLEKAVAECRRTGIKFKVGNLLSTDAFYHEENLSTWKKMGVVAVEMECAALYMNALEAGKNALTICTVSDIPEKGIETSAEERETGLTDMIRLALEIA